MTMMISPSSLAITAVAARQRFGGTPTPVAGDLIEFAVLGAGASVPNGGVIDFNGTIARMRFKGMAPGQALTPAKGTAQIARPGWDASFNFAAQSFVDPIGFMAIQRQMYPNQASLLTSAVGSDVDVFVVLDAKVFRSDTPLSVTLEAGFYGASNAITFTACTNASSRAYPMATTQFVGDEPYLRITSGTRRFEATTDTWHAKNLRTAAGMRFYLKQGATERVFNCAYGPSQLLTAPFNPDCWGADVTAQVADGFVDGAGALGIRVYPWVGDEVWDSGVGTMGEDWPTVSLPKGLPCYVDMSGNHAPVYAVMSPTGSTIGSPTVSLIETTQAAYVHGTTAAFGTETQALDACKAFNNTRGHNDDAAAVLLIPDQSLRAGFGTRLDTRGAGAMPITMRSMTGATTLGTGYQGQTVSANNSICPKRVRFENIELRPIGDGSTFSHRVVDGGYAPTAQPTESAATYVVFKGVICTGLNDAAVFSPVGRLGYFWVHGCTLTDTGTAFTSVAAANFGGAAAIHGTILDRSARTSIQPILCPSIIGCRIRQYNLATIPVAGAVGARLRHVVHHWIEARISGQTGAHSYGMGRAAGGVPNIDESGLSIMNVVFEKAWSGGTAGNINAGTAGPLLQIVADYISGQDQGAGYNIKLSGVTVKGGRKNAGYAEATPGYLAREIMVRAPLVDEPNNKSDNFDPDGGGALTFDGTRTGANSYRYGQDSFGRVAGDLGAAAVAPGPSSWLGEVVMKLGVDNVGYGNMIQVDTSLAGSNQPFSTSFNPRPKTIARNRVPAGKAWSERDLYGTPRLNDGTGAAGALEYVA